MRWCYSESTPYDLDELGEDAWQTGCPLCGDQCLQCATEADKKEAEEYYDQTSTMNSTTKTLSEILGLKPESFTDFLKERDEAAKRGEGWALV